VEAPTQRQLEELTSAIDGEVIADPAALPEATAFVHRRASFWIKHGAALAPGTSAAAVERARRWVTASWETVHPFGTDGVFPNFPDPDLADWARAYYGSNLERLVSLKSRYDPDNLFRFPQSLPVRSRTLPARTARDTRPDEHDPWIPGRSRR
jgi:hypothetical protein